MREPGVEHEGLGLAERIDHAVQEAHEERGVEAHRAGRIEQHDEPQRLDLAPAPGEIDRRAAVADIAVDGAAQVEPPAAPAHLLAPHEPRPHGAREPRGERVGARDLGRIGDVAQVGRRAGSRRCEAPSRRPRPSAAASSPLSALRRDRAGPRRLARRRPRPMRRSGALPAGMPGQASARGACRARARTRRKISSNRSQSERVAQNSARNAGLSDDGRAAAGEARIASASRVSARPTVKPLSRSVRAKPASRWRRRCAERSRHRHRGEPISRHLAEQPLGHLAGEARRGPRGS